jgi:hypothetical protein
VIWVFGGPVVGIWDGVNFLKRSSTSRLYCSAMSDRPWVQGVLIIAAIAGFVQLLISLWSALGQPSERLHAEIRYAVFELPPDIVETLGQAGSPFSHEEVQGIVRELLPSLALPGSRRTRDDVTESVTDALEQSLIVRRRTKDWSLYCVRDSGTYYNVSISNTGGRALKSVLLTSVDGGCGVIKRPGQPVEIKTGQLQQVEVGTLQPQDTAVVAFWSRGISGSYKAQEVRLSHENGIGSITIIEPAGRVGRFVDDYGFWILLTVLAAGQGYAAYRAIRQEQLNSPATPSNRDEPTSLEST